MIRLCFDLKLFSIFVFFYLNEKGAVAERNRSRSSEQSGPKSPLNLGGRVNN